MSPTEALDRLLSLTMEVHRILRHQHGSSMQGIGVNALQLHGLIMVREHPGLTMKELAMHLSITSSSVTAFVTRLERLGLLKRFHDRKNRKIVRVRITPKANRLIARAFEVRSKAFRDLFGYLSPNDQHELTRLFEHALHSYRASLA